MDFQTITRQFALYWRFAKEHKTRIFFILVFAAFIELFTLGEKYVFKFVIDDAADFLAENISLSEFYSAVLFTLVIFTIVILVRFFCIWVKIHISNIFTAQLKQKLKVVFYNHILGLSYDFHTTHKSGMLITRLNRGERAIEGITESLFDSTLPMLFQILFVVGAVFVLHWSLSLIMIISIIILLTINFFLQKKQLPKRIEANLAEDVEGSHISDSFTNIDTIKLYGKESFMQNKYFTVTTNTKKKTLKWEQYFRYFQSINMTIPSLTFIALLGLCAYLLTIEHVTVGDVVFVQAAFFGLIGPLRYFMWMFRNLYTGLSDLYTLSEYLHIQQSVADKKNALPFTVKKGLIEFDSIRFKYKKTQVLQDLSLTIKSGQKIAIIGHSGSGKSTLIKLLYRLYDVQSGDIRIDSQSIRDVKQEELRSQLSIVPQEGILFDDTLYNNILFVRPSAKRLEVLQAIKDAQLQKVIEAFPQKEKTIVGERGVKLSGGERQRVAIARALLANKKIVVLDEATSALDSHTEHAIQKALKKVLEKKTAIIIAHRLSTVMSADKIVVLQNGLICEVGTHEELINKNGLYTQLWNLQKGGYL